MERLANEQTQVNAQAVTTEKSEDLGAKEDELSFCIIDSTNELINEVYPQDVLIDIH